MKTAKLNEWLGLVANIGVLVGLVFLIVELDQANRVATYQAESDRTTKYNDGNLLWMDKSGLMAKLNDPDVVLSGSEYVEARHAALFMLNIWLDSENAYESGLITERTFDVALDDIRVAIQVYPGIRPIFENIFQEYESETSQRITIQTLIEEVRDDGT